MDLVIFWGLKSGISLFSSQHAREYKYRLKQYGGRYLNVYDVFSVNAVNIFKSKYNEKGKFHS